MKKSRFLSVLCVFLVLFTMSALLTACTNGNETDSSPVSEDSTEDTTEVTIEDNAKLKINGINICDYSILYNIKANTKAEEAFKYLKSEVLNKYDITLVGTMHLDTDVIDKEKYTIVFGLDGNDDTIKTEYEKCDGGFIGVSGKVIYVLGKDLYSLKAAVNRLLDKAEGDDNKSITVSGFENINATAIPLKVLQYNVLYDSNKEGRPSTFLADICDTIREQDPDVFGTQEYNAEIIQAFKSDLTQYSSYMGAGSTAPDFIYWKTEKFNVIKKGYFFMSNTPTVTSKLPGSNQNRAFSYVILEFKENGKRFVFVNVHTDYKAEDSVRKAQLAVLTSLLPKINPDNLPIIFVGDFNATPTSASVLSFLADNKNVKRSYTVAEKRGDTGGTLVISGFTERPEYVFDYIFISTDSIKAKYYSVIANFKEGKSPSDHLPVFAELELYY